MKTLFFEPFAILYDHPVKTGEVQGGFVRIGISHPLFEIVLVSIVAFEVDGIFA